MVGGSEFELMGGIVSSSILFTEAIAAMKALITTTLFDGHAA